MTRHRKANRPVPETAPETAPLRVPADPVLPAAAPAPARREREVVIKLSRSPKQRIVEEKILACLDGLPRRFAEAMFRDNVLQALQEYANGVSIARLGMNDHGPVHMRIATHNAIQIFHLLVAAGIQPNLVKESCGSTDDALIAVMAGSCLHDLGMSIGRDHHELMSVVLAQPHITRLLSEFYHNPGHLEIMRSLITECIAGHMATQKISSLEAGIVLVADGCDMIGGRARIPMKIAKQAHVGDIHRYSAASITDVEIVKGEEKPVRIVVSMSESAGFFQIENVLMPKITASPAKQHLELVASCEGMEPLRYL